MCFVLVQIWGNFSRATVYLSFVVAFYFGLCIKNCLSLKDIFLCVLCSCFVIIVFLYLASQTVSYFPFSRSTHQRYNTNSKSSWNFELFTEYFKYFDYSCNHISFGFFVLSMNFMQSQVTYEIAVYTYSLVILNNSQNLKIITVNAFLLQKFTVITKFYSAKENSQTAP